MAISMHQASVPVFVRALKILGTLLEKGEQHAEQHGIVPDVLLGARLFEDMLPLTAQVQRASDTSKLAVQRLSGVEAPRFEDSEASFQQLQERIASTIAYLDSVAPQQLEDSARRVVKLAAGAYEQEFQGDAYLLGFAIPNFFFHVVTAYDILRQQGVPLGKRDYLGSFS